MPRISRVLMGCKSEFDSEERLEEAFADLKGIDAPEVFETRLVDFEPESVREYSILFTSSEDTTFLEISGGEEEGVLTIEGSFSGDINESILEELSNRTEVLHITHFHIGMEIDTEFDELNLPINENVSTDYTITGLRIKKEGYDFIIQELESGTSVVHNINEDKTDNLNDFIGNQVEIAEEFIQEVNQNGNG